jgi:hypothetical protein
MDAPPPLTLLLGPQTAVSLALNSIAREHRATLAQAGMTALPSRAASPLIRRCLDDRPLAERRADLAAELPRRPAFLAAVNFFGPPEAGLSNRELFPDAEMALAGLSELAPGARILLAVDPLPRLFLAARSEALETRVRRTPWEDLYEIGWADLVREVVEAMPGSSVMVLTGQGTGAASGDVMERVFGEAAAKLPPHALLTPLITETGRAVLTRLVGQETPDAARLAEVYASFADLPDKADIRDRLGIDKVTRILLDQRFEEDRAAIAALPGVEVI